MYNGHPSLYTVTLFSHSQPSQKSRDVKIMDKDFYLENFSF